VTNAGEFIDPALVPKSRVRVAAFDGENADPANGRKMGDDLLAFTPWGEIAYGAIHTIAQAIQEEVVLGAACDPT